MGIRSQSANLQNVMESLSNQNTISDIGTGDTLQLNSGVSPLHMFMFLLLAVWGFLYVNGRQRTEAGKPSQGPSASSREAMAAVEVVAAATMEVVQVLENFTDISHLLSLCSF